MAAKWKIEFYEDAQGRRPVEKWIDGLSDQKAESVVVALQELLAVNGISLASGAWLKPLGMKGGLDRVCVSTHNWIRGQSWQKQILINM